jgi:hypothetical protein
MFKKLKLKLKSTQKWLWYGLMKIWLILGHWKVHNFFLTIFLHICFFCFNISYIKSLYYIPNKIYTQKCMYIKTQTTNWSIFFNFKSPLLYIWCIYFVILKNRCLLQVDNLNLITNFKKYYFYVMLIICKCMPFYKKLDCNAKNEPPYLATTQHKGVKSWRVAQVHGAQEP